MIIYKCSINEQQLFFTWQKYDLPDKIRTKNIHKICSIDVSKKYGKKLDFLIFV